MTNQRRNPLIELPPMPDGTCATEVGGSEHNPKIYFECDMREYARAALAQQDAREVTKTQEVL